MSPECRIETAIPRPLSAAAAEPFPQGSTFIPYGMEICEVQIFSPCQATMCLRTTNYEKNGVQSAMSPSAIRNVIDTIFFPSEQTNMYVAHIPVTLTIWIVLVNFENTCFVKYKNLFSSLIRWLLEVY